MNEILLRLSQEERDMLIRLLGTALGESRVEVHHTHFSPAFRQQVLDEEHGISELLAKLKAAGEGSCTTTLLEYLKQNHISFDVVMHPKTFDAQHLAGAVHVPGQNVAKGVLVRVDRANRYILAVLPATYRIDIDQLSKAIGGSEVQLATEFEIAERFPDCEFGALPPLGSRYGIETLVDRSLTTDEYIVFEADKHDEAIRMTYAAFNELEHPSVVSFAQRN
jgi:Ala-tRNA(Pro) deacylase